MSNRIANITANTKDAIKRKSAYSLPDRPSDQGMKPEDIKRAFWQPITDMSFSVLSEIDRVINEINAMDNETEKASNKITAILSTNDDTQYPSAKAVYTAIQRVINEINAMDNRTEKASNKVTAILSTNDDTQYPSAKAVYTAIETQIKSAVSSSWGDKY